MPALRLYLVGWAVVAALVVPAVFLGWIGLPFLVLLVQGMAVTLLLIAVVGGVRRLRSMLPRARDVRGVSDRSSGDRHL